MVHFVCINSHIELLVANGLYRRRTQISVNEETEIPMRIEKNGKELRYITDWEELATSKSEKQWVAGTKRL